MKVAIEVAIAEAIAEEFVFAIFVSLLFKLEIHQKLVNSVKLIRRLEFSSSGSFLLLLLAFYCYCYLSIASPTDFGCC